MKIDRKTGRLRVARKKESFNPMDGMANLADVMLVFACGLLIALIASWNVDISSTTKPENRYEIEKADGAAKTIETETDMEEMGTVYKDPETGKYYIVEDQ